MPGSATAPGPGRSAAPFTTEFCVAGMQNTAASVAFAGTFVRTWPAAEPVSLIWRQVVLPKQPAWVPPSWPVQNRPSELVVLAGPVVSGERVTLIGPTCPPSQQPPPPDPQGQLQGTQMPGATQSVVFVHAVAGALVQWLGVTQGPVVPPSVQSVSPFTGLHGVNPSPAQRGEQQVCPFPGCWFPGHTEVGVPTPPVGQSRVKPVELVEVQGDPARGPRSQVPVYGGVPSGRHAGHGWVGMPVR